MSAGGIAAVELSDSPGTAVDECVFVLGHNAEVRLFVIGFITVDMVYDLVVGEVSSECFLSHESVFQHVPGAVVGMVVLA